MVIRHEYFGNLIWSDTNKCYFICADRDTDKQLEKFLQGEKQSVDFLEELKELGLTDSQIANNKTLYVYDEIMLNPDLSKVDS